MSALTMEQQVNLYQPILGAERHLFSVRAIGICLALLAACLAGLGVYGSLRTSRAERAIAEIERRQAAALESAQRTGMAVRPAESVAQLDADARGLTADIAARERALALVHSGAASPETGFAARLEALGRRQPEGLWLSAVAAGSGEGRLAMRGNALDPKLVPSYLAALAEEPALSGVRFDRLTMRSAKPDEAPARIVFELDAPGLGLADREVHP